MTDSEQVKTKSPEEIEAELLEAMSDNSSSHESIIERIVRLKEAGGPERADAAAGIYQEELRRRGDRERLLSLLELRGSWRPDETALVLTCRDLLLSLWTDRRGRAFVRCAGFESCTSVLECLRRFRVLISLRPGSGCRHPGWGFGVVREFDDFDERMTVDFEGRSGQRLSYSHAAEVLEIVPEDHLMAVRARNPESLRVMARSDPGGLAKLALRSLGPLTAEELRAALAAEMGDEDEWQTFWENARRVLRNDPLVKWPVRRSDPIRIVADTADFGRGWIEKLKAERNPERIIESVGELRAGGVVAVCGEEGAAMVADKLVYAARAFLDKQPDMAASTVVVARNVGVLDRAAEEWEAVIDGLMESSAFAAAVCGMPARELRAFLPIAASRRGKRVADLCVASLAIAPVQAVEEMLRYLAENGFEIEAAGALRQMLASGAPEMPVLAWCCRHLDLCEKWQVSTPHMILMMALGRAGAQCRGKDLKARRVIQEALEDGAFLDGVFDRFSSAERAEFVKRLRDLRGWDPAAQRSLMAKIIRTHPELAEAVSSPASGGPPQAAKRVTSWRSFRQRQAALKRLVEVEIPANSREIGVARSYGDLSENAEYKFAKEHQRLLMKRQEEMERDLKEVVPTDFSGYPADSAGMGACVKLLDPEGRHRTCIILGEWDGDEERGVISCKSAIALRLAGRRAGEDVVLPDGDGGERAWRIVAVEPLPEDIVRWARGEDLSQGAGSAGAENQSVAG